MISRYNGTCSICGKPTKANVDEYDTESRKSYHVECFETEEPPGPEQHAFAESIGWISHTDAMARNWVLFYLHEASSGATARGFVAVSPGRQSDLF